MSKKVSHRYNLGFISDEIIYEHVKSTVECYRREITLPQIIEDVVNDNKQLTVSNTVFKELTEKHTDLLTAIYLLAFSTYDGFEQFLNG